MAFGPVTTVGFAKEAKKAKMPWPAGQLLKLRRVRDPRRSPVLAMWTILATLSDVCGRSHGE